MYSFNINNISIKPAQSPSLLIEGDKQIGNWHIYSHYFTANPDIIKISAILFDDKIREDTLYYIKWAFTRRYIYCNFNGYGHRSLLNALEDLKQNYKLPANVFEEFQAQTMMMVMKYGGPCA